MNPGLRGQGGDAGEGCIAFFGLMVGAFGEHRAGSACMVDGYGQKPGVGGQIEPGKGKIGEVPLGARP